MNREETIKNLEMIRIAFVEPVTKEQKKLIDDTFDMAIKALEQEPCDKAGRNETIVGMTKKKIDILKRLRGKMDDDMLDTFYETKDEEREALSEAIKILDQGFDVDKHDAEVIAETVASIWGKPPYTEVLDKIKAEIEHVIDYTYDSTDYDKSLYNGAYKDGLYEARDIIEKIKRGIRNERKTIQKGFKETD